MSGIEIAGLVLAVVPILVSTLEQYKTINRKRDFFRKRELHVDKLINALKDQEVLIESDLELLLRAANIEVDMERDIKAGQCVHILSADDVSDEIELYLGTRYRQYIVTLERSEKSLIEIARSLSSFKPGPWRETGKLREMLTMTQGDTRELCKRLKFSLSKEDLDRQITELDSCTRMLSRLRELGMSIHDQTMQTASRHSAKLVRALSTVRSKAMVLYNAISAQWTTACHHSHGTDLLLQDRLNSDSGFLTRKAGSSSSIQFRMIFRADLLWHHADIDVFEPEDQSSRAVTAAGVKFNLEPQNPPLIPGIEVRDLCLSMAEAQRQKKYPKLVVASQSRLYSTHQSSDETLWRSFGHAARLISLKEILSATNVDGLPKLTLMQRTKLMFVLASSAFQLHATPWIGQRLRKESIHLLSSADKQSLEANHPFLSYAFPEATELLIPNAESILLELGIVIMELWHNTTLEYHHTSIGTSAPLDNSYYARHPLAKKWLEATSEEFVPSVLEAASRCIGCRFAYKSATPSWDDEDFRKSVFDGVVKPLWDNCSFQNRS